ncbi:MAG: glycosyltransferase [bacterium]
MQRRLADLVPWDFSWQKVKGFLHHFNLVDHLFAVIVLSVVVPLRFYWKRVKGAANSQSSYSKGAVTVQGAVTVSMIYDSVRIATGRVDAAYDYIVKLDQSLNSTQKSRSRIRLVPESLQPGNTASREDSHAWKLKNALKRAREIAKEDSQIVHIHYTVGAYKPGLAIYFVPLLIRFFSPRPRVVITYHQFTEHKPSSFLFRSLLLLLCLSVDGYIFLRTDHSRAFVFWETFLNKNYTFIPSPSNLECKELAPDSECPEPSRRSIPDSVVNLSHFGTIRQGKGLEILIRAFAAIHERYPAKKLILAGAVDDSYHRKLMGRISACDPTGSLTEALVFTGQLAPDKLYRTLLGTVVVLPFPDGASTYRSSLMAALGMGLTVITTMGNHTPELFEDGKNCFLARCGSWEDLAAAMDRVLSLQASDRERVGMEGYRLYTSSFSWSKCLSRHLAFYRNIL